MTDMPSVGIFRTDDHRYYENYGEPTTDLSRWVGPYPNVTGVLGMFDKSEVLVGWAKKETARFALQNLEILLAHRLHNYPVPECPPCATNLARKRMVSQSDAARMWVSSIPDYMKDKAADLGTAVHGVAEAIAKGEDYDPDLAPFAGQYQRFLADYQPEFLAIEYMGVNRTEGYAGTGDAIAWMRLPHTSKRCSVAFDIKTWTKDTPIKDTYYPETGMQLAACSRFEFIGKPDDPVEYAMPRVDAHAVLLIGAEDYRLIPYTVTRATYDAFLACLQLRRWKDGEYKTIVGRAA